jgi:uncharacterized protein (TIGR02588 family)
MAKPDNNTPVMEWIAAGLGAAAIIAVLGVIVYGALTRGSSPPKFHFDEITVSQAGDLWHVSFRIRNSGDIPAASVKVVAELSSPAETAEVTLRYVPDRSTRKGGLYFRRDPGSATIDFSVTGYEVP